MYYLLQGLNVIYFTMEAVYAFSGSIYVVAAVVFWEGLLGGGAYVNTYFCISKQVSSAPHSSHDPRAPWSRPARKAPECCGLAYPRSGRGSTPRASCLCSLAKEIWSDALHLFV